MIEPDLKFLGQALRQLRNQQGSSQVDVATSAGITKAMMSAYETGRQIPSLTTLIRILKVQNFNLADLQEALLVMQGKGLVITFPNVSLPHGVVLSSSSSYAR